MSGLRAPRSPAIGAGFLCASVVMHAIVVGAGVFAFATSAGRPSPSLAPVVDIAVELGTGSVDGQRERLDVEGTIDPASEPTLIRPGGGEDLARPDTGRRGRGGSRRADSPALNLAERDEGLTLNRELKSRIDREQIQRVHTAATRTSPEDRRSLADPMDLVFLATGEGNLRERRPPARTNPGQGALRAPAFSSTGSSIANTEEVFEADAARREAGRLLASPGVGLPRGVPGPDHRLSAAVATGRPRVARGPVAFAADDQGPNDDTVDSEQEVAATIQSLVHASTAGGQRGPGAGGEEASDLVGSGGVSGPGSRAVPFGGGPGPFMASDDDPRASDYWRSVQAKIYPLWAHAFPKWASLEGRQGWAIVSFVIYANGQVDQVRVTRPSGVPEFDENVRRAVLAAAPFAPLPPTIPGPSMRWRITFDMKNPVVR